MIPAVKSLLASHIAVTYQTQAKTAARLQSRNRGVNLSAPTATSVRLGLCSWAPKKSVARSLLETFGTVHTSIREQTVVIHPPTSPLNLDGAGGTRNERR